MSYNTHTLELHARLEAARSCWDPAVLNPLVQDAAGTIRELELELKILERECERNRPKSRQAIVYFHDGEDFAAQFRAVLAQGVTMAAKLSDIGDRLTALETLLTQNKTLLEGLNALIAAGGLDTAAVQALVDRVTTDNQKLADDIKANSPA